MNEQAAVPALKPDQEIAEVETGMLASIFTFTTFEEAKIAADIVSQSDFVGKDYKGKPGNILVAWQTGAEIGLPPMSALKHIAVINGKGALYGDGFLAVCMRCPDFVDCVETFDEATFTATCIMKRRGREDVIQSFSKADAEKAGLWDDRDKIESNSRSIRNPSPWYNYQRRMTQMRARGFSGRDQFADVLSGIMIAEEAYDHPAEREVFGEAASRPPHTNEETKSKPDGLLEQLENKHQQPTEASSHPTATSSDDEPTRVYWIKAAADAAADAGKDVAYIEVVQQLTEVEGATDGNNIMKLINKTTLSQEDKRDLRKLVTKRVKEVTA